MSLDPFRIVQISDTHLFSDKTNELLGVNTFDSFMAVLNLIKQRFSDANAILVSGDLSQDASEESYCYIADELSLLNIPIYYVPGNHDDKTVMEKVFPRKNLVNDTLISNQAWQILLLNSQKPNAIEGFLAEDQFDFLKRTLEAHSQKNTIVVFHHHPMPVTSPWIDQYDLKNADTLWSFLKNYPQVKSILFGHIHQVLEGIQNGIAYYSAPSTCIQFKPAVKEFALDNIPQGLRCIDLFNNGTMQTAAHRLPYYIGQFQKEAKGY